MASHLFPHLVTLAFPFLLLLHPSCGRDVEREMTVEVKAGTEECFYEVIKAGETVDIEYQVRQHVRCGAYLSDACLSYDLP